MTIRLSDLPQSVQDRLNGGIAPRVKVNPHAPYKSGLEAAYAQRLDELKRAGEIVWWAYEPWRLRIGKGAAFTPDFVVKLVTGETEFHETKGGFCREAALVRLKCAAGIFPYKFLLVTKPEGH